MPWINSTRHQQPGWPKLRASILGRDHHRCTVLVNGERCNKPANEVDHIINTAAGGTDHPSNLAAICRWHHRHKSSAEGNTARTRTKATRPTGKHPGITD